jgi:hypothetical protein
MFAAACQARARRAAAARSAAALILIPGRIRQRATSEVGFPMPFDKPTVLQTAPSFGLRDAQPSHLKRLKASFGTPN